MGDLHHRAFLDEWARVVSQLGLDQPAKPVDLGIGNRGRRAAERDDAGDANDDGSFNVADAVYELTWLFSGGPAAPPPVGPNCGSDPTSDSLDCASYDACP